MLFAVVLNDFNSPLLSCAGVQVCLNNTGGGGGGDDRRGWEMEPNIFLQSKKDGILLPFLVHG
jgi:hypothetical protein